MFVLFWFLSSFFSFNRNALCQKSTEKSHSNDVNLSLSANCFCYQKKNGVETFYHKKNKHDLLQFMKMGIYFYKIGDRKAKTGPNIFRNFQFGFNKNDLFMRVFGDILGIWRSMIWLTRRWHYDLQMHHQHSTH